MSERRLAVVGGGVGGLATALGLSRIGVAATVYERRSAPPVGGGLWLFSNGLESLDRLSPGLGDEICQHATVVRRYLVFTWSGKLLWRLPLAELESRLVYPTVLITRRQLITHLLAASEPHRPRYGRVCTGFTELGGGVLPVFSSSTRRAAPFDGLVGADGFRSVIRRQLFGPEPSASHPVTWLGMAETDSSRWPLAPGDSATFLGGGRMLTAGTLRARSGDAPCVRRVFWNATEVGHGAGRHIVDASDLARRFHPRVVSLMARSPRWQSHPIRDRRLGRRWGEGRVTLVGDAAHAMTPDAGQGAGQAFESALALVQSLQRHRDVPVAFRDYERRRMARSARVVGLSRLLSTMSRLPMPEAGYGLVRWIGMLTLLGGYSMLLNPARDGSGQDARSPRESRD